MITSPRGSWAAPSRNSTLHTDGAAVSRLSVSSEHSGGATIRKWYIGHGVPERSDRECRPVAVRDRDLRERLGVDEDIGEVELDQQRPAAVDRAAGDHAGGAEPGDLDGDVDLLVEPRGRLVADRGLDHLEVDPLLHHRAVTARVLAPELGQGDVVEDQVVGVEDDS